MHFARLRHYLQSSYIRYRYLYYMLFSYYNKKAYFNIIGVVLIAKAI